MSLEKCIHKKMTNSVLKLWAQGLKALAFK